MNPVEHFIHTVEYLARDDPDIITEFKSDLRDDLRIFLAYIEELESPIDRPGVKDELEAQDDVSFKHLLSKYRGVIRDIELGNLRREAAAICRDGLTGELLSQLCNDRKDGVV